MGQVKTSLWRPALLSHGYCRRFSFPALRRTALILLFTLVTPALSQAGQATHDEAVALARSGNYQKAIVALESLHHQQPGDEKVTNDLIVIYNWAGEYQQACSLFEQHDASIYPPYVLTAVLDAYHNLDQLDKALDVVNTLLIKQPGSGDFLRYKALLHLEKHQSESARATLETINVTANSDIEFLRLSAKLHAAQERWLAVVAAAQQISSLVPEDEQSLQEQFYALQHIRASEAANIVLLGHSQLFTAGDHAQLLLNQAAEKLRWSTDASKDFQETKLLSMQALDKQIKALDVLGKERSDKFVPTHVLNDIIVTLRNLRRMDDVEVVYELLATRDEELQNYVKKAAAGAKLANHSPDEAGELYSDVLQDEPDDYNTQVGLFYSYLEAEDITDAYNLIENLLAEEPFYQNSGNPQYRPTNNRFLDLTVYGILARQYGDQLQEAYLRADELVRNAPANNWLYEVRGQISQSREWYRQALYDFHYAELLEPDSLNARAGVASNLIALKEYTRARPLVETIQKQYPEEYATKALTTDWIFSRKPEYWADITWSHSSGPELDGDGILASTELLSSPINDHLYIDGLYRYAWNEIIEGEETFERYSLGLDYQLSDTLFLGRVNYNDSSLDEVGGSVQTIWTPDDFWRLTLSGERFAIDTPLRALYHHIRSDAVTATINYRWSEQRDFFVALQGSSFTDGNERAAGNTVLRQRLIDIPHFDLDGRIEVYASTNSKREVFYFNPEQDLSLTGALHLDHLYYRHYDDKLSQMFDAGYGIYDQKGYDSDWIGHLRYEQRYQFNPWLELLAGIEIGRNVYDGDAEPYQLLRFMINGKI